MSPAGIVVPLLIERDAWPRRCFLSALLHGLILRCRHYHRLATCEGIPGYALLTQYKYISLPPRVDLLLRHSLSALRST